MALEIIELRPKNPISDAISDVLRMLFWMLKNPQPMKTLG